MAADPPDPGLLLTRGHTRSSQCDRRYAEVEAVALWLAGEDGDLADFPTNADQARDYHMDRARNIIAVLGRARSPQGKVFMVKRQHLRPDQRGEPWNDWTRVVEVREAATTYQDALAAACGTEADGVPRPPQGKNHEAGKLTQAATIICALIDQLQPDAPYDQGEALTAANLWLRLAGFTEETTPDV